MEFREISAGYLIPRAYPFQTFYCNLTDQACVGTYSPLLKRFGLSVQDKINFAIVSHCPSRNIRETKEVISKIRDLHRVQ